jgi:nucleoside-diphosphate-sugar epimerase
MSRTIVVTGITGFIAQEIAVRLLGAGHQVRGTLRRLDRQHEVRAALAGRTSFPHDHLSFAVATLEQDEGWAAVMRNADGVMHCASPFPLEQPRDPDALVGPARDGALRVLEAALAAGVRRVVMTSSVAAVADGHRAPIHPFTEAHWTEVDGPGVTPYARSKTLAERAAWTWARQHPELELVTILPGLVLGPVVSADFGVSPELIRRLLAREVPGSPRIGFSVVDVRDVADAHLQAFDVPSAANQRFICTTDFRWMRDMARVLRESCGAGASRVPTRNVPDFVLKAMSLFDPAVRGLLADLGREKHYSHEAATRVLGWRPRSADEAIAACGESLIRLGLVSPRRAA